MRPNVKLFGILFVLGGCEPHRAASPALCVELAGRCGGADPQGWQRWCESDCVPETARRSPCRANAHCLLCDAPRSDGRVAYFALPEGVEYLWTSATDRPEATRRDRLRAPSGTAFDDRGALEAWRIHEPYDVALGEPRGFCEPGPNQFVRDNVVTRDDRTILAAERLPEGLLDLECQPLDCASGPYAECGAARMSACSYGDDPENRGIGSASQIDRAPDGELATYGFGRYRAVMRPSSQSVGPQPGFVYAFYLQGNEYCRDGAPNVETNTAEIDVEISSGFGSVESGRFCDEDEMCVQFVNWASSGQGVPAAHAIARVVASGFHLRDPAIAREPRAWGFDWSEDEIRFTYDADPNDCDEPSGACAPAQASIAMCRHTRFVPRRPSPLHFQVWGAHWAGRPPPGTRAEMTVERVWHAPFE